jgi:hypothetical protein
LIDQEHGPYADLNEFMAGAVETQLNLSEWQEERRPNLGPVAFPPPHPARETVDLSRFLVHPSADHVETALEPASGDALFVLTNRLAPMAFGMRMLVNAVAAAEASVPLGPYLTDTARWARQIGLHLRAEDREAGRVSNERRWIGWPVGDDELKAVERFKGSFLITERSGRGSGPLVDLGLANLVDGRVLPTATGKALGTQPSPLLGETTGWTLGEDQVATFLASIRGNNAEVKEILLFARLVRDSGGRQPVVDRDLRNAHPNWSMARAVAHRAAMLGRLKDLGLAEVHGSGTSAVIKVSSDGIRELAEGGEGHEATA